MWNEMHLRQLFSNAFSKNSPQMHLEKEMSKEPCFENQKNQKNQIIFLYQ